MNRILFGVFTIAVSLAAAVSPSGCKSDPPPAEEPDLGSLREKLDATKQDMAEARLKLKEAVERSRAERLADQEATARQDASPEAGTAADPAAAIDPTKI